MTSYNILYQLLSFMVWQLWQLTWFLDFSKLSWSLFEKVYSYRLLVNEKHFYAVNLPGHSQTYIWFGKMRQSLTKIYLIFCFSFPGKLILCCMVGNVNVYTISEETQPCTSYFRKWDRWLSYRALLHSGCARVNYQRGQRYLGCPGQPLGGGQGAKPGKPPEADAFVVLKSW